MFMATEDNELDSMIIKKTLFSETLHTEAAHDINRYVKLENVT